MSNYKISVIVPVYNVKEYIDETIKSIYNQTLKDFELILIDDGSTDGTYEMLKEYESKHNNIKLIKQENSGPSKARNVGLKEAEGEYIIFVDSDDLLPTDSFEFRYKLAKEKNADVIVCGTEKTTDGIERKPIARHMFNDGYRVLGKDNDILWALGPCNKIFKREIIEGIFFPLNIDYAEDQVFMMEAFLKANKLYATKHVVYYYRMRKNPGESLTQQISVNATKILKQVCTVWKMVSKIIDENTSNRNLANSIKVNYFYRLMIIDVWPSLDRIFRGKDEITKNESLNEINSIVSDVTDEQLKKLGRIKRFAFEKIVKNSKLTGAKKIKKIRNLMFMYKSVVKAKSLVRL